MTNIVTFNVQQYALIFLLPWGTKRNRPSVVSGGPEEDELTRNRPARDVEASSSVPPGSSSVTSKKQIKKVIKKTC